MSQIEVNDIEEAKLIISMKNDEIKSISNKMKMTEKKSNIKIAESNYQIQQEKNKVLDLEKKMNKLKENCQLSINEHLKKEKKNEQQTKQLKEQVMELQKNERQIERSYKASTYELELKLNDEKEKRYLAKKQLDEMKRIFNIEQIIKVTHVKSLQEIPPYLTLCHEIKERKDEIFDLTHHLQQYKSETLQAIEESFSKLTSYEQVMDSLREKNEELEKIMEEKNKNLQITHNQLEQKEIILQKVQAITSETYSQLNKQIEDLRGKLKISERESMNYSEAMAQQQQNLKLIIDLNNQFQSKQENYIQKIEQLEHQFELTELKNRELHRKYNEDIEIYKEEIAHFESTVRRMKDNAQDKENIIQLLNNSLKELEIEYEGSKNEINRYKLEISEILKKKHKIQEELNQKVQMFKNKQQTYIDQIDLMRNYNTFRRSSSQHEISFQSTRETPTSNNLKHEITHPDDPDYQALYEQTLHRHNNFLKALHKHFN